MRLTSHLRGERHATVPRHDPLRVATLAAILAAIAAHHGIGGGELLSHLME